MDEATNADGRFHGYRFPAIIIGEVVPWVLVTDKLRSYGAATRAVMPSVEHRSRKRLNNRVEV